MQRAIRILSIIGTRPEAIKMAPVIRRLAHLRGVTARVCVTAQHREMLDQVLELFQIRPDHDLDVMRPGQDLSALTCSMLQGLGAVLEAERPDRVLVHGDTTTAFAAALAAFYRQIPVAHVEAGLRTGDRYAPWPEEINRHLVGVLADLHFAPTTGARDNLLREGVAPQAVDVTGNTVIDALLSVVERVRAAPDRPLWDRSLHRWLDPSRRLIVVTGHRRESFGGGFRELCAALLRLAARSDVQIVYPVHRNPNVLEPVHDALSGHPRIRLIEPLQYLPFVALLDRADVIITDSGGIQEEAPSLGKPVLVTRTVTERPEAVSAGTVRLVGTSSEKIVTETERLLDDAAWYESMARAHNPYGDGRAAGRIVKRLLQAHDAKDRAA